MVEAFRDCMERISQLGGLKHDEGTKEAITESKSLMRGQRVGGIRKLTYKFRVLRRAELRKRFFTERKEIRR